MRERARVKGDWLIPLPAAFTPAQAMAIGTAGYTAMLCVIALERFGLTPGAGAGDRHRARREAWARSPWRCWPSWAGT